MHKHYFTIPKAFYLLGHRIEVVTDGKLTHNDDALGLFISRENKIALMPSTKELPIPQSTMEQVFCHELVHALFFYAEKPKLFVNEELVNLLGGLLHQALTTLEYDTTGGENASDQH